MDEVLQIAYNAVKAGNITRAIYEGLRFACRGPEDVPGLSDAEREFLTEEYLKFQADPDYQGRTQTIDISDGLQCLDEIEEEEVEWLIPGYLPKGTVALLAGDGGTGKTGLWCHLLACITSGKQTMFEREIPFADIREPCDCMFFSSEDSVSKILKRRLRLSGADMKRIFLVDLKNPLFAKIKLDSPELAMLVKAKKPALCVIDPLQSFLDSGTNMISRNAMRNSLNPLRALAEETDTVFLIACHTNKSQGTSGRKRVSDSSDLWDFARTVLIAGRTQEKLFYVSHEKANYGPLLDSILFSMNDGVAEYKGTSSKHDADFQADYVASVRSAPAKIEAKEIVVQILEEHEGKMAIRELDSLAKDAGVSPATLRRAKEELQQEGRYKRVSTGYGKNKQQIAYLLNTD